MVENHLVKQTANLFLRCTHLLAYIQICLPKIATNISLLSLTFKLFKRLLLFIYPQLYNESLGDAHSSVEIIISEKRMERLGVLSKGKSTLCYRIGQHIPVGHINVAQEYKRPHIGQFQ